jgi:hypothetical protein
VQIAPTLRFQDSGFLADYAVMQQTPTQLNVESNSDSSEVQDNSQPTPATASALPAVDSLVKPTELGGRDGPDPTRFGDWEKAGRCIDF